jgi:16S rRNA (uracil1498-N3)-methyltransferase
VSELRAAAAHAFVDDLDAPVLSRDDRHHLERVLRLRAGEEITVADGAGRWRLCRYADGVEPVGEIVEDERSSPPITVGVALTKGERLDWAVQKLTELGVDLIVPFAASRSVVRWDGNRAAHHVDRLRRITRQAAMQSRRTWLPEVGDLRTFADAAAIPGAAVAEPGGGPPSLALPVVLVGPEGGWAPAELANALPRVALGPLVLRSETAAVAAGALLCALRAGLLGSGGEPQ